MSEQPVTKRNVLDNMAVQYGYEDIEEENKEEEEKSWLDELHEMAEQRRRQQLTTVTQ